MQNLGGRGTRGLFTAFVLVTACATTRPPPPTGGPRGLRATEHLDVARQHDRAAKEESRWPDTFAATTASGRNIPWFRSWDSAVEQERLAEIHRTKAAELQAAYEDACGTRAADETAVSPLQRYAIGGWNTTAGVIVYLAPTTKPDTLMAELRCHRAWMMLAPAGMDDCPLDLPGLVFDARGDGEGTTLSIVTRDASFVGELQRRTAHDLEAAARRSSGH